VDELIPGKVRGTVDLVVNGTFWVGATLGSLAAMFLLHGHGCLLLIAGDTPSGSAAVSAPLY
jgi:hypothetical protein